MRTVVRREREPGTYAGLDRFGRVMDLQWRNRDAGDPIERVKYGYDRAGNRVWRENASLPQGADELYAYDGMNQLVDAQRGVLDSGHASLTSKAFQQQWSLDAAGNWSAFQEDSDGDNTWDVSQTRAHNAANELLSTTDPTLSLVHDRAGNMTLMPAPQSLIPNPLSLVFDAWNRLVKVAEGEVTIAEYAYDGLFRRIQKRAPNGSTIATIRDIYYSASWQVLEEYVGDEGSESLLDQRYAWGVRYIDDLIFREYGEDFGGVLQWRLFAMQDANWNVIAAAGWTGTVHERYRYDAYGAPIYLYPDGTVNSSGSDYAWPVLFTGRHLDPDTNLYHYRYRDYHHSLGRFVSRDPLAADINLCRYVRNNPVIYVDPSGLAEMNPVTGQPMPDTSSGTWEPVPPDDPREAGTYRYFQGQWYRRDDGTQQPQTPVIPSQPYPSTVDPFSPDFDPNTWSNNHNWDLLSDFWNGTGQTNRFYGPDTIQTLQMWQSPGAAKLRDAFHASGCNGVKAGDPGSSYDTGEAARQTTGDLSNTAFQVGGFNGATAVNNGDGTVTFTIPNDASRESFYYHGFYLFHVKNYATGPKRTIHQTFQWTENIDNSKCCQKK